MRSPEPRFTVSRRRLLGRLGAVGVASIAGCAGGGADDPTTTTTATTRTSTRTTRTTTTPATTTTTESGRPTEEVVDPASLPPERRFDFWAGEWDVFDPAGRQVGTNVIRSHAGGNLLFEHWSGSGGSTGVSMNYYDFAAENWVQSWVSAAGSLIVVEGDYRDGAMRLSGRRTLSTGTTYDFRSTYTPNDDGTVGQLLEESSDGGESWRVSFDGTYRRRGDAGPEEPPTAAKSENAGADPASLPPPRRFDFWLGTWDVERPPGTVIVRNVVQSLLGGHLVVENWDGAGIVGKSFNYWNPATEQWVKRWVPDNGNKVHMTGGFRDGAMRLEGTLSYAYGDTVGHRASFTPSDDGTVTQRIQLSHDGGETWSGQWEGRYVRVEP